MKPSFSSSLKSADKNEFSFSLSLSLQLVWDEQTHERPRVNGNLKTSNGQAVIFLGKSGETKRLLVPFAEGAVVS